MSKILGIDIGHHQLKLALLSGNTVIHTVVEPMQDNLIRDNKIISIDLMADYLRNTMKKHHIHCKDAAIILLQNSYYLRTVSMPVMNKDQLRSNIPYEFIDYINDDLNNYLFDYVIQSDQETNTEDNTMTVLIAAVQKSAVSDLRTMLHKAGLRMVIAAPGLSGIASVLRMQKNPKEEYGILDLGHNSIRLNIFQGDNYIVTHVNEHGLYEAGDKPDEKLYNEKLQAISIDLMRAINFHKFSNPESMLQDLWVCGSGSMIHGLLDSIRETVDMNIHMTTELLNQDAPIENGNTVFLAAAIALNSSGNVVNFATVGQRKSHMKWAVPGSLLIIALAFCGSKYLVADRLSSVFAEQKKVKTLQKELDDMTSVLGNYDELKDSYEHLTISGLTEEELGYTNRLEVLRLIDNIIMPQAIVKSWTLSGNLLKVPVSQASLQEINKLIQHLSQEECVSYCMVSTASKTDLEDDENYVTGEILIYLKSTKKADLLKSKSSGGVSE